MDTEILETMMKRFGEVVAIAPWTELNLSCMFFQNNVKLEKRRRMLKKIGINS